MSCIDALANRNPYIYGTILSVATLTAIAAVAIGVITLLANQHLISFPAFSLSTPVSLGMAIPGSLLLGGILILALRHCCKQTSQQGSDGSGTIDPSTPSGGGITGNPAETQTGKTWDIEPGKRKDKD